GQKTTSKNPRSTVGTITEVYDFLRLLYSRVGHPHCPECGREIARQSTDQIVSTIWNLVEKEPEFKTARGVRLMVLSPVVRGRKGEYSSLFQNLKRQGFVRARIDGVIRGLDDKFELIKTNSHDIEVIVSREIVSKKVLEDVKKRKDFESNLTQSVEAALRLSNGNAVVTIVKDKAFDFTETPKDFEDHLFSENFACPVCNISLPDLEPRSFSFNSPHGACPACDGLGSQLNVDETTVMNPTLSISEGGVFPWSRLFDHYSWTSRVIKAVSEDYGFSLDTPIKDLSKEAFDIIMHGAPKDKKFKVGFRKDGQDRFFWSGFEGVVPNLIRRHRETKSDFIKGEIERYMVNEPCPVCNSSRLKKEILSVVIDEKNIWEVTQLSIGDLKDWCDHLKKVFSQRENTIAEVILKEINYRLVFLLDVGLGYLTLSRASSQLSGGEAQRIRLASQIGSGLSGVLYVLDEPSIGLHQKDQRKLIMTLKHLRDLGNTVLVVEHDKDTMLESDYIFDFGPGAGERGGEVVAEGTPQEIMKNKASLTGKYLSGEKVVGNVELANVSAKQGSDHYLELKGASGRNLKNIDMKIPLGDFVCVTGVSGSGKSSLVMDTLHRVLRQEFGLKNEERPLPYESMSGVEHVKNVIAIDQSPIGRTPKSNPATYTKAFDHIRELFAMTQDARIRGYKAGRFSFNVKGGRCEACGGEGQIKIEMQFMPDVYVNCEVCEGKRYNKEALEILYKGKNIADVLDMTVEDALEFFDSIPPIQRKLQTLNDVGLGYIRLGQPAPTLSGGEAQRVKLALELSKMTSGGTFYILDEPTTGLHFADLERLIAIIKRLSAKGNTVVVIEHNLDVIANADWVIDMGPEGGEEGGKVIFSGPLTSLLENKESYTAQSLRELHQ
ncbi:MAG: excinuclease ABC subunit UvrA, partial [Patescibacteria group bacterium]